MIDDLRHLGLGEAAFAQEVAAVLVDSSDDPLRCRLDVVDERHRRGVGEEGQRRGRFTGEPRGSAFRVEDGDLFEILDTPEIAILADRDGSHPRCSADGDIFERDFPTSPLSSLAASRHHDG